MNEALWGLITLDNLQSLTILIQGCAIIFLALGFLRHLKYSHPRSVRPEKPTRLPNVPPPHPPPKAAVDAAIETGVHKSR